MKAILVLDNNNVSNFRMLVVLSDKNLEHKVLALLNAENEREAFDILRTKSEWRKHVPFGRKLTIKPEVTIYEKQIPVKG